MGTLKPQLLSSYQKPPRCWIRFAHRRKPQGCQSRSWSWPDSPLEGTGFEPSVPPFRSGVPAPTAGAVRRGLFARGNRIRTIGPALPKRSLGCCRRGRRTDKLDGAIKHRSSRETTMVGRGASLHGRLFLGGTDGSNPVPSSAESANYQFRSRQAASVGMSLDNNAPIYSRMAWPMISAGKRYPPQRARAGVVIPPDYLPRYVRASVANVRQVDGASRRTFYRICSITSRLVSFEQAERFKARRASWKASATCSRRSGPPPTIRALHSQLFFDLERRRGGDRDKRWRSSATRRSGARRSARNSAHFPTPTPAKTQVCPSKWRAGDARRRGIDALAMLLAGTPGATLGVPGGRNRRLGVLLGSGSERLCRRGRAVLPEEPA